MNSVKYLSLGLAGFVLLVSCSARYDSMNNYEELQPFTTLQVPATEIESSYPPAGVARGRYLVSLLGCSTCHSNGALIGRPDQNLLLAGSQIGIAYTSPLEDANPGILFPPNLTPDLATGIGDWTLDQIINMLLAGIDEHGARSIPIMPWPAYAKIKTEDAYDIAAYLKSLAPVKHQVPANVQPGTQTSAPFVHFGVYRRIP